MPAEGLRILGPIEVVARDGPTPLTAKQRRVLAVLLVSDGHVCPVDQLVEAVWDGKPPASAAKLVQVYVSQLRKRLPAAVRITTRDRGYALDLDGAFVDATQFERLVADCRSASDAENPALAASLARQALDLWRGRPLGELGYAEFAQREVGRLEELRLVVLAGRLAAELELGRDAELIGEVLAFADENPYREQAQALAMLALYRTGRQTEALDYFAAIRRRLDEELGLEPGPAVRELQRRILQQDPALEPKAARETSGTGLPIPPYPLVGRERELEELQAILARRESRLVVLTGAGGSGKTRLAIEVAMRVAGLYANGVSSVDLAPLRDPALVVPALMRSLGVSADDGATELDALVAALATQELLLVIDNAEHVREAAPAFAELVARAPRLTVLATSRAVLHVSGELVFPVSPLPVEDAMRLFEQRAKLMDRTFALSESNEADVRDICMRVDGLPLAIELAAARIRTLSARAIRTRLDDRLGLLTGGPRDVSARQRTLRETIDWSVGLLDDHQQRVLTRCAVFPGGASLEAAEEVCGADVDTLGVLVDHSMLNRDAETDELRFQMFETIREHALQRLGDERSAVERALAVYLAELLDRVENEARLSAEALAALDPEIDNVRAAIDACVALGESELGLRLAGGIWRYCWVRGMSREGLQRIELALATAEGTTAAARSRALHGSAGLAWSLGDFDRATELAAAAIPVAVEAGLPWDEMSANTVLGVVANNRGDRAAARHHHRRAIEIGEREGLEPVVQKLNLGIVALDSGEYEEAKALFEDVLAYHRRTENVQGMGFALLNLGVVHHSLGDHAASLRDFEEARDRFAATGFRANVARALQGLAAFEASEGRGETAARLLGQARRELDDVGSSEDEFAADMVAWTKSEVRNAIGDEAFEVAYEQGRLTRHGGDASSG